MRIYADNAATTAASRRAIDAMLPYFDETYGNPSSIHADGQNAARALLSARESVAARLGASAREITFTSGGSESDVQALISAARIGESREKRHIVSTAIEHHAVLGTLKALEKEGFEVTLVNVGESGIVDPADISSAIREDTCLVSVMYANNEIGTVQPITEIGRICKGAGVLFHTDAVQAAGQLEINVKEQNIDLLSLSAHKFHGPKGVGALYSAANVPLTPLIYGGRQERGRRAGTENLPAIVGMAAALDEACENMHSERKRISAMRDTLIDGILCIEGAYLNGDRENRLPGNASVCFDGVDGEALILLLDSMGISASSGSACMSGSMEPSHVLLAIGRDKKLAGGALRLSLSSGNNEKEAEYIINAVKEAVSRIRSL